MAALTANFKWTAEEGHRMRRAWLRFTDSGRIHRRNAWIMFACGVAGLCFGVGQLLAHGLQFGGVALSLASAVLLLVLYALRIKQPPIARSRADVRWQVLPDHLVIDSSGEQETLPWRSIARVVRTPDGFLMWRSNGFEIWLPLTAFASAEALSEFSQMAQTHAQKYVQIS